MRSFVLGHPVTAVSNLNVNGLTTLNRGQTNFTAVSSLDITNKAYVDTSVATAIANISVGSSILATNNIFTGTNEFNNNITAGFGFTTDLNGVIRTKLNSLGFTSASFTTSGITGTYSPPLGTITNVSGSTYQIAQTNQGRAVMAISGFAPSVLTTYVFQLNIKCTIGTAILSVEQDNILRSPQYYQLSTNFNTITGSFYYDGNPSTIIFNIYTGIKAWNAQWDSFTLSTYSANIINAPLYAPRITTANSITLTTAGGALTMASNGRIQHASFDNSYTLYGPNSSWGKYLAVGSTPDVGNVNTAQVIGTNGDLFLDAANSKGIYYGNYASGRGTPNSHTFYGNMQLAGNEVIEGGYSFKKIGGNVGQNYFLLTGDDTGSSPYLTFYQNNIRRCYMGNATATEVQIATENGAQLAFLTAGTTRLAIDTTGNLTMDHQKSLFLYNFGASNNAGFKSEADGGVSIFTGTSGVSTRMTIKPQGDATYTAGDSSYMRYGPNGSWNSYLTVGATPDRSGASNAQVIATNGNLHLDGANSSDIYYGYYPNSRGTPNSHRWYGTNYVFETVPQNGSNFSQVAVFDGNTLKKSQCVQKLVYFNNNVAWGGGVNMTYAFYLYNTTCSVQFWGKNSGYYSGGGMMQTTIRVYSQSAGTYYHIPINAYVNNGYNHFTVPLNYASTFPYTGWYDIYVYSTSGWITDGNDQLTIGVTILPVSGF